MAPLSHASFLEVKKAFLKRKNDEQKNPLWMTTKKVNENAGQHFIFSLGFQFHAIVVHKIISKL